MISRLCLLWFFTQLWQPVVLAQQHSDVIQISTPIWPGFINADGTGAYIELFELVLADEQREFSLHFSNFGRAIQLVQQGKSHMVPGLSAAESKGLLLSAHPFDFDLIMAIYHPQHSKTPTLSTLATHKLAWDLAYDLHLVLGLPEKGYEVLNIKQGIELVRNRRVDIYLAEKSELQQYLQAETQMDLSPLSSTELARDAIYLAFANTKEGRAFKGLWDKNYLKLYRTGQLKTFYRRYPQLILPTLP